jgi:ketosteroid isomerase-like protein
MPDQSRTEVVAASLAAFNDGELDDSLIAESFDPNVELLDYPDIPGRRIYRGHSGVREFLSDLSENWADAHVDVEEIREVDGMVLVLGTQTASGALKGTPVTTDFAEVVDFDADRISRVRMFRNRNEAREAAGA